MINYSPSATRRNRRGLPYLIVTLLSGSALLGADVTWTAGSSSDLLWSTSGNWDVGVPTLTSDVFLPKPVPNPGSLTNPQIITLGGGSVANSLTFFAPYTLTGGDLALTSGQIAVTIGNASTIESKLTGSGGLLKLNDGALKLTNADNDYTGVTQIDAGSVIITNQSMLGDDLSAVIVTGNTTRAVGGGSLVVGSGNNNLDGLLFTRDLALTGGGASGDGAAFNSVGNNTFTGNIVTGGNPAGLSPVGGTPITATSTRLAATFGTTTIDGSLTIDPSGQTTEFTGNGNWVINSDITGAGNLSKSGSGLLILNGNNSFGGTLTINGGFTRITDPTNLGTSTAGNAVDMTAGTLEIRSDAFTSAAKVRLNSNSTIFVDHAIGSTALDGTVQFGALTLIANRTMTINGRNGYGLTFLGNMTGGSLANPNTINNNANGLVTYQGTFWNQTNTTVRTFSFGGNGDSLITSGIIATGAAHNVTKTGTGTLTINGTNSNFSGNLNVNGGTVAINDFRAITNNTATINIGTSTTSATLSIVGNNLSGANVTTNKVVNLAGTTGGATILANQTGTSPGVRFNANFTATGGSAANAKTLTLGGTSAQDNTIVGSIPNNAAGGAVNVTKIDPGTWVLAGQNTYTGTTTIANGILKLEANAATSTILPAAAAITFTQVNQYAGGTLELVGQAGVNNVQALGTLSYAGAGANTVKLTPGLLGTASLTFANMTTGAGGSVNFVGGDFTNNTFTLAQINGVVGSDGIITRSVYWNGADFAYRQGGVLRAPVYGVDAGTVTSATALAAGNNEITGSFATNSISIATLKINGGHTLTINPGNTLTMTGVGILATGGNSIITGDPIAMSGSATMVVRVDGGADSLRIESAFGGATGGLTKNGAGVLVLAGTNTQTGTVTLNEGTVRLSGSGVLGANNQDVTIRQGATYDLNGVTPSSNVKSFNSNGTVTNSSSTPVTLTVGGGNGTGVSNGIIEDGVGPVSVTKLGTGGMTWNMASTYTGVTTIGSTGIVVTPILSNIGSPSSLGAGDATSDATNAASLVFDGASATQAFGGINYNGRDSLSIDRLFTFGGTAANSGARIQANGSNNATLIWSNSGALAFGTANVDQGLVLGGASIGDNQFNPQITDNGSGVVSLYKADAGLWILGNAANSYTGVTQINGGALRADGSTLPTASPLVFNGGVLQSSGDFTRSLTATPTSGAGGVNWAGNGGFAASADKLTVNLGGNVTPDTLQWGSGGFVSGTLILSSTTALAEVEVLNPIDLNAADRTIQVDTNSSTNSDLATLTGVISTSSGTAGLIKTGTGILRLLADNTYNGDTNINGGTVRAVTIGNSTSSASNFGAGTGKINIGTGGTQGNLVYVGGGETTDRLIEIGGTTANVIIESSGTGPLVLTNVVNASTGTGAKTFFLRGDLNAANEITSALSNNTAGGVLNVTKDDNGTWILSGDSTYSGSTTVSAGPLGLAIDSTPSAGTVTSGPVGTGLLIISNGSVFALNGDRTIGNTVRFNGNSSANFIGINSITLNGPIATTTGGNTTVTNMLPAGKLLTLNSPTYTGTEATSARTLVFNGSGDTILNASVTNSTGGATINLNYQGYGSLTLGGSNGASTYTGSTTIQSGTLKVGVVDAIPNGATASDVTMNPALGLTATLDLNGNNQTINGLVANSLGTANIDNSAAIAATFTFGSQDKAVSLIGNVLNTGAGALSLVKTGSNTALLTGGTYDHTGTTTVNGGVLSFGGDVTATTGISVTNSSTLNINGGFSGSTGVTSLAVGGGSTLSLSLDSAGTPLSNLTSLDLGAGVGTALLRLNVGDLNTAGDNLGTDLITLLSGGSLSLANSITINMSDSGLNPNQTYTLLNLQDGGLNAFGIGNVIQGTTPGGFATYNWTVTDNLVQLTVGNLVTGVSYWNGATGTEWNLGAGQWSDDKAGTTASITIPGAGTDVIFSSNAGPAGALTTTLEQNFKINSLTFEAGTTTPTSVTIASGTDPSFRLQVAPQVATDGVKISAGGPAAVTISAPFRLGADQTWSVADAGSILTFGGALQGEQDLTISGAGKIILGAAATGTFNPGLTSDIVINGGTVELQHAGALGTTVLGNTANVSVNSGAAFYYNGAAGTVNNPLTLNGGTLSAGTANQTYNGAISLTADSFVNLRDSHSATTSTTARTITLSGALTGTGKISLDSVDTLSSGNPITGTLVLNQDNSGWSGGFDITRGTVQVTTSLNAFGTGPVSASGGRIQFNLPANNTVNLAQNFTVDGAGGVLELSVDAQGTLSGDLTINLNGTVTLGSNANANNALRITQSSDNFSIINLTNSVVLGNDASISYQGNALRPFEISGIISETGGARSLAINDELGGWAVTSRTIRLSGANTFTGGLSVTEGALEFSTVSDIGGPASNLGQGNSIGLVAAALTFIGDTASQSTNRPITITGASTLAANGTNGATITYSGAVDVAGNTLSLIGTGEGSITGGISQTGTAADINVNSGIWHLGGALSTFADDIIVTGTTTGTAVLNFDTTGSISYTAGTSNGWYIRDGGVINLNADDVNGVNNSGGLDFILIGNDVTGAPATFNVNTFNVTVPRLDLGGIVTPGRTGIVTGTGTITGTYTGTDYAQGFRLFDGSISANLAGTSTILKQSVDTVTLSGDNSGLTATTATRIDSGTLILDYTTSNTTKLSSTAAVDLRGGTIQVLGNNTAATNETLASLTLGNGGSSEIQVIGGTGQDAVLNLGAITRANTAADGTMRFILPTGAQTATNGIRTTSPNSTSGLLGNGSTSTNDSAYATVDDGTGIWFAKNDGSGNIIAQISTVKNDVTTWLPGDHVTDDTTGYTSPLLCANINSLRFDATAGSDITLPDGGLLTISSGGILLTSNVGNSPTIIGGTLTSGATEIIITHDSASTFEISSDIRVNHAVTKTGGGTLLLTGNNVYTDETEIQEGILLVNGTSIGDASPVNLADDHVATLKLLNSEAIGRLTGGSNAVGLDELATVDIGVNTLTINSGVGNGTYSGKIIGSGTLIKNNSGSNTNQAFAGASTGFNGTVIVNGGLFQLTSLGAMNATDYILNSGSSLLIDNNGTTTTGARILDTATITLNSADGAWAGETRPSGLAIRRDQNSSTTETVGVISLRSGASYARLDATGSNTSNFTEIIANNIERQNNATLDVRGTNLGASSGRRVRLRIGDATNQTAFVATLIGGGGAAGTPTQSIVPWAMAELVTNAAVGDANMGNSLATYVSGQGFRALDFSSEYSTYAAGGATSNVRESLNADLTGLTGKTLNALVVNNAATAAVNVTGSGTLTNTSGTFLFTVSGGAASTAYSTSLSGFADIAAGNGEYIFFVQNPSSAATTATLSATIGSPLSSSADLTKSGRGTLVLTGVNTAGGGANKTTLNEGILEIADLDNIGGNTGDLIFAGGTLRFGVGMADDISQRSIFLFNGGGTIDTNGIDLALANSIGAGLGGITKTGLGTLTLNAAASYSGPTVISGGTLAVGANNATGVGGDLSIGAGATLDLGANSITAGLVSTSGASPAIVGTGTINASTGFAFRNSGNITVDAVLAGAGGLFKNQTNVLTLTGLNTYTGTTEVQSGTLSFDSIGMVGGGASALGAPATIEDGIIRMGLTSTATSLTYTGSGHVSDRIIEMQGTTGGLTLNGNGTGAIAYGQVQTATGGNKTLTLRGTSDPALINSVATIKEVGSVLTVNKSDANTWLIEGASSYTGATQVDNGTLMIGVADALPTTTTVRLGTGTTAGTLDLNGFNQAIGSLLVQTNSDAVTNQIIVDSGNTLTINGAVSIGANVEDGNTNLNALGGGAVVVNSGNSNFIVGTSTAATNSRVDVDFSGLSSFTANLGTGFFRIGDPNTDTEDNTSTMKLAVDNTITAAQIRIGDGSGGGVPTTHTLTLGGGTNLLNADALNIGSAGGTIRSGGAIVFDPGDTTGTLTVRAADGTSPAVINLINTTGSTASSMESVLNTAGHSADILASTLTMASRTQNSGAASATLTFDQGTLDVTTFNMASRTGTGTGGATATVNIGGGTTTIDSLNMAVNTSSGGTVTADFNVTDGDVTIGAGSGTAINMANAGTGRSVVSNITLEGGNVTVTGNIIRTGGAGSETATVTLDGSTLNMSGNSVGSSSAPVTFQAQSGSLSNLGQLNDGGTLTKDTLGTLTLGNGNTFTGGVNVAGGILLANNTTGSATGSGPVSVDPGTILGGDGIIAPAVGESIIVDGDLFVGMSGASAGADLALTTSGAGSTILNGKVGFDIFSGDGAGDNTAVLGAADLLVLSGPVTLGGTLAIGDPNGLTAWASGDKWRLFDWALAGTPTGTFTNLTGTVGNFTDLPDLSTYSLAWDVSDIYAGGTISIVTVPEPGRMILVLFGLMGLVLRRRRK
ncbi:MAG: autotransporter-associated beta strand repeat-containing protein [Verrucomicrobiales bacterium]|nr:autotransporter-associated beta strand repeat-containing protein [Verrucomicrobiales bacterium]MCP5559949.1 autotransporter-associated beta strand repeat-containing protein [Verrucomicrobiaceae bacterium]